MRSLKVIDRIPEVDNLPVVDDLTIEVVKLVKELVQKHNELVSQVEKIKEYMKLM